MIINTKQAGDGMKPKICVLGSLIYDCVIWADRLPKKGETVIGYKNGFFPGGKGANQGVQAARIGADVCMIGKVGIDTTGDILIGGLKRDGIDTTHITKDKEKPTSTCAIHVDKNGDNTIVIAPQANRCITKTDIDAAADNIKGADVFLTQLETNFDVIPYALDMAKKNGVVTVLNPAPAGDVDSGIFKYADYITPNETEAEYFTGVYRDDWPLEEWVRKSAQKFINMGAGAVVITLGEKGAAWSDGKDVVIFPPYSIDAVDSTAAGDAFNGAFAYALALRMDMKETMDIACAAGALTASKAGAQTSIPYKNEIIDMVNKKGR